MDVKMRKKKTNEIDIFNISILYHPLFYRIVKKQNICLMSFNYTNKKFEKQKQTIMNLFCSHIIPFFLVFLLLFLGYWAIKLDKLQDYKYSFRQYWKCIQCVVKDLEKKLHLQSQVQKFIDQANIKAINLEKQKTMNQILSNQNFRRKNSIKINSTSSDLDELKRKNSIDYTIQINQILDQNEPSCKNEFFQKQESNKQNYSIDRRLDRHSTLKVHKTLAPCIKYQRSKQSSRQSLFPSNDYLKLYVDYQQKSRRELISMQNARSNQNIEKIQTFSNLCEINGIKTIRDLIKQGY